MRRTEGARRLELSCNDEVWLAEDRPGGGVAYTLVGHIGDARKYLPADLLPALHELRDTRVADEVAGWAWSEKGGE